MRRASVPALLLGACALLALLGPPLLHALGVSGAVDAARGATPPSLHHPLGTDPLGRDLLLRVLLGARLSLGLGVAAAVLAVAAGALWGGAAGYAGGWVDEAMMRLGDALAALPATVLVLVALAVTRSRSAATLVLLLAATSWLGCARVVRGRVRALVDADFVVAARALGAHPARVLLRHVLPQTLGLTVVYATLVAPAVIVQEAFLSFLGVGVRPPAASLGSLVAEGVGQIIVYPWILAGPAVALALVVGLLALCGDALGDALDVKRE